MESFGHHLTKIRESRSFTVNQLGMYSGISSASISRYESGERNPKPESIKKLSEALKYSYEELMTLAGHLGENEKNNYIEETLNSDQQLALEMFKKITDPIKQQEAISYMEFLLSQQKQKPTVK